MTRAQTIGQIGEDAAATHLIKNRYAIIARNYLKPWGEIDIIARSRDTTLVFVEVKTLAMEGDAPRLRPEDNMTSAKVMKTKRAALAYANANPELVTDRGWRIDMISVELRGTATEIRHHENI